MNDSGNTHSNEGQETSALIPGLVSYNDTIEVFKRTETSLRNFESQRVLQLGQAMEAKNSLRAISSIPLIWTFLSWDYET